MSGWLWGFIIYAVITTNLLMCWGAWRRFQKALAREADTERLQVEAIMCADLLRELMVTSFMQQHAGTFHAWAGRMGHINVRVDSKMHPFEE